MCINDTHACRHEWMELTSFWSFGSSMSRRRTFLPQHFFHSLFNIFRFTIIIHSSRCLYDSIDWNSYSVNETSFWNTIGRFLFDDVIQMFRWPRKEMSGRLNSWKFREKKGDKIINCVTLSRCHLSNQFQEYVRCVNRILNPQEIYENRP